MRISYQLENLLWEQVRAAPDKEVCGFIDLTNQELIPITNVDPEPAHYFSMDEHELVAAVVRLRSTGADFAVYHSHPTATAIPSEGDRIASGTYPKHVILAPRFADLRAYVVRSGEWSEVAVDQ